MSENDKAKVLKLIADDMADDAARFDGQPFNGRTVAEYLAHLGAAIAALANIVATLLPEIKDQPLAESGALDPKALGGKEA